LNEVDNLVSQIPTQLSRANPERPRLSVDLPHWTVSVFGMPMPVDLGCQIHVDIKKSPSVQKNRMIVVLVALNMAVLPADGATCADGADRQDHVKVLR
jgi:hypothetical protein